MPYPPLPPSPFPPYRHWYTDVEPAYEQPAECDCHFPPTQNNCVCVTNEDADNWNGAFSAISAVSAGLDIQAITSAAQLLTSADYWNQTYETVSANSATWQQLPDVSSTLAEWSQSAIWMAEQLSANGVKHDDTLTGDGIQIPLGVAYSEQYDQLIEYLQSLTADATTIDAIMSAMKECKESLLSQIAELSGGHIQNYELILQIMGMPVSAKYPMCWTSAELTPDNAKNFDTVNWMYYKAYEG